MLERCLTGVPGAFVNHWRDATQLAPRYYWYGWCLVVVGVVVDLAASLDDMDEPKNGFRLSGEARLTDGREEGAVGEVDPAVFDGETVV